MDFRVKTTRSIWGMATGMLGICVPLCTVTHSGAVLPIAVLVAAGVSTATVWLRGVSPIRPVEAPQSAQNRVKELEERLANLEAITNLEHKLLDKKYPGAAPVPAAPAFSFEKPASPPMPVDSGVEETSRSAARPIAS